VKSVFKAFDQKGIGQMDYMEFLKAVVGPMSMVRKQIVGKAFDSLD
jgi:Ca2+-binding EF-hand superfamily protein